MDLKYLKSPIANQTIVINIKNLFVHKYEIPNPINNRLRKKVFDYSTFRRVFVHSGMAEIW